MRNVNAAHPNAQTFFRFGRAQVSISNGVALVVLCGTRFRIPTTFLTAYGYNKSGSPA
jgi:hypothetical protein